MESSSHPHPKLAGFRQLPWVLDEAEAFLRIGWRGFFAQADSFAEDREVGSVY
jgi:hypothetical protein